MVLRTFFAFDNDVLIDQTTGEGIINNSDTPIGRQFVFNASGFGNQEITLDDTGGDRDTFEDDDEEDHVIVDGGDLVDAGTEVEAESIHQIQQVDASGNLVGPVINVTVFSQDGQTSNVWGLAFDKPLENGATYQKIDGTNKGSADYHEFVPCFAEGTSIRAAQGHVPIETLSAGDQVWTTEGMAEIQWIGSVSVAGHGRLAPIVFEPGVIGNTSRLTVSPQHRVLLRTPEMQLMFEEPEMLTAAKHLLWMPGVSQVPCASVAYWHMIFDRHRIICSDGALTESLFPSPDVLDALEYDAQAEILDLFPELRLSAAAYGPLAAPCLAGFEAQALAQFA